ncbi:MAG: hypothetical protein ACK4IS_07480 [Erythrobacter sp.]
MRHSMMAHGSGLLALAVAACSEAQVPPVEEASPAPQTAASAPLGSGEAGPRHVMLSSEADNLDPCALAMIYDPPSGPDQGAVMVFGTATTDFDMVDTLMHTDKVWVCETSGDMIGIVYPPDGEMDCELSLPKTGSAPYSGPCQTGWVKREWVQIIAG